MCSSELIGLLNQVDLMKSSLAKYKSYTSSGNLPKVVRDTDAVISIVLPTPEVVEA